MTIFARLNRPIVSGLMTSVLLWLPAPLMAQGDDVHPGEAVFTNYCAGCHDGGDPRAASTEALRAMSADNLLSLIHI